MKLSTWGELGKEHQHDASLVKELKLDTWNEKNGGETNIFYHKGLEFEAYEEC
jgi:hypothetical protein